MSLTSHLADKNSGVRAQICAAAPLLAQAGTRGKAGRAAADALGFDRVLTHPLVVPLPDAAALAANGGRAYWAATIGTAFDYRARMALGSFRPEETVALAGVDRIALHAYLVPNATHRHRVLLSAFRLAASLLRVSSAEIDDDDVDRAALLLTFCEQAYRGFPAALNGTLGRILDQTSGPNDLLAAVPDAVFADLRALSAANRGQLAAWRTAIDTGARFVPNPDFPGSARVGGAEADWLIGPTLIDCKTISSLSRSRLREVLLQLVGYTMLDFHDALAIRNVAVWLPRYAALEAWPLADLTGPAAP